MRWGRWLGMGAVAAAVALLIGYGFRPQPVRVDVARVERGSLRITVEEEGKTRVTDRYVVSAPVSGYAQRLKLEVGDPVREGQALLALEPLRSTVLDPRSRAEAEARVAAAEAAVASAQEKAKAAAAEASYWEGELARVRKLHQSGDVAAERLERTVTESRRAEAGLAAAEQAVEVARSELEASRAALRYSAASETNSPAEMVTVRAPVGGRVLKIAHKSEGVVNAGAPILEIANARLLEVQVEVLSADAVKIKPGMRVVFERWGGEAPLEGQVQRVEPVAFTKISALGVEEQRVLVIVGISSPQQMWNRLGDGYRVEAVFILWEGDELLRVPASALFRHEDGWAVFVREEGVARRRKVEVGHRNGLAAEVVSGLSEGQTVIVHPDEAIADGTPVEVRETAASG